ncbi:MAG: hypothetical protein E7323_09310 [Clostridiales bacterium]|nr:hypothetical protein [Clostridiales bacterium]
MRGESGMNGFRRGIVGLCTVLLLLWGSIAFADASQLPDTLCITELMTDNESVWSLGFEDYVEIYNGSSETILLSDYYLSGDRDDPTDCRLPKEELAPGAYRVFRCDGKNLKMKLGKSKGELILFHKEKGVVDQVTYPALGGKVWLRESGASDLPSPGFANTNEGIAAYTASLSQPLMITEVMTSNSTQHPVGESEEYYDLVELYNPGAEPVQLNQFCLSDKKKDLTRWQLPEAILEPGSYYIVYASGNGGKEASFKLSSDGEELYLSTVNGECVDMLAIPQVPPDASYGRWQGQLFYYDLPTIGKENAAGYTGVMDKPVADHPTGLYGEPFQVSLSGDGQLRYTLDGSDPTSDSPLYDGTPIPVEGTTFLRVMSCQEENMPSPIATYHYLFDAEKYELPIVSVSAAPGKVIGRGSIYDKFEYKNREDPANLVLIENGQEMFNIDCGLKIHGQGSRQLKKKSFQVRFRGKYGASTLDYPVFEDLPYTSYNALILRSGSEDGNRAMIRDEFLTSLTAQAMPEVLCQAYRPVNLIINGEYYGVYFIRERLTDSYVAAHLGGEESDVDMVKGWSIQEHGSVADFTALLKFCRNHNLAYEEDYQVVAQQVHLESFMDYYIARAYTGDRDYPNIRHCRSAAGDGLWRIINFDIDWGFGTQPANLSQLIGTVSDTRANNTVIINALLENDGFRDQFLQRMAYHMGTTYAPERVIGVIDSLADEIRHDMPYNQERWNQSMEKWEEHLQFLRDFVQTESSSRVQDMLNNAKRVFRLSDEEMIHYFGDLWIRED